MRLFKRLLILFLVVTGTTTALAEDWELINSASGITVYRRERADSSLLEFKGQGTINASPSQLLALLQDVERMPEWVDGCSESMLVKKNYNETSKNKNIKDFRLTLYGQNGVPWPVSDRDYVLEGKIRYAKNTIYIDLLDTTDKKIPPKSGIVRMNFMKVKVTMRGLNNNKKTWFQLYVYLDPGGLLPAWVVNFVTKRIPLRSIKNLRRIVKKKDHDKDMQTLIEYHLDKERKTGK